MHLSAPDGQSIELRIVGYQFPDSNWLTVEGSVCHPSGNWSFRRSCLLTYEVLPLADWLEAIGTGTQERPSVLLTEPNLYFQLWEGGEGVALRVYFELECRPAWAARKSAGELDLWVEFPL